MADDNFFSRWSRRKVAIDQGVTLSEPQVKPRPPALAAQTAKPVDVSPMVPGVYVPPQVSMTGRPATVEAIKAPSSAISVTEPATDIESISLTLDDVQGLTAESDFKPFIAKNVAPDVRNAAMKKLFTDPHYNVMDRLDIYIDDYSQPDPLPESMLRQMASAKFLNLFTEEDADKAVQSSPGELATTVTVAASADLAVASDLPTSTDNPPALAPSESVSLTPAAPSAANLSA